MQRMYKRDIAKFQAGTRSLLMAALEKNIRVYKFIKNERIFILKKNNKTVWLRGPRLSISNPVSLWIIKDKHLTKEALKILKIPTPDGYTARTLDEAIAIAKKIKFPLVIKPRRHEGGEGVFLNVDSLPKLEEFFKKSLSYGRDVILEKEVYGKYYRVTMAGNKVAGILETSGLFLPGDGTRDITQLIHNYNKTALPVYKVTQKTKDILAFQGFTLKSVPKKKVSVQFSFSGSEGGVWIDRTEEICKENALQLSKLTKYLDLKIAGIDIIAKDISQPIVSKHSPGYVLEINGAPEVLFHLNPSAGKPRDIGKAIISTLF